MIKTAWQAQKISKFVSGKAISSDIIVPPVTTGADNPP